MNDQDQRNRASNDKPPKDDVEELFDAWDQTVRIMNGALRKSTGIAKGAWGKLADPDDNYDVSNALSDSARAYALGLNTWRGMAQRWSRYIEPVQERQGSGNQANAREEE